MVNKGLRCPRKVNMFNLKIIKKKKKKKKSKFLIYADFVSILVPEDNGMSRLT